jgi:hypothetical protein
VLDFLEKPQKLSETDKAEKARPAPACQYICMRLHPVKPP